MEADPNYHSYLLRLWRDGPDHPWRASLQCTVSGERVAFADLQALIAHLLSRLALDTQAIEQTTVGPVHQPSENPPAI